MFQTAWGENGCYPFMFHSPWRFSPSSALQSLHYGADFVPLWSANTTFGWGRTRSPQRIVLQCAAHRNRAIWQCNAQKALLFLVWREENVPQWKTKLSIQKNIIFFTAMNMWHKWRHHLRTSPSWSKCRFVLLGRKGAISTFYKKAKYNFAYYSFLSGEQATGRG